MRALLLLGLCLASLPALAREPWEIDDCGLEPEGFVPPPPVPPKAWEPLVTPETPDVVRRVLDVPRIGGVPSAAVRGQGALAGKVVYLSPSHGFTWTSLGTGAYEWRTQRGNTQAIVEDLVSIETLSQYLTPMLLNAGARVVPVRELDLNPNLVIVDNDGAGYAEQGSGFSTSSLPGWRTPTWPMDGDAQPFGLGTNRLMPAAATATASATYTLSVPQSGAYQVYVSYSAYSARVTDAHYVVRHAGGETHFRVNQQRHGGTWVLLGRFYFRQGGTAQVVVQNDSAAGTGNVSLDAVRLGGGAGLTTRTGATSGRPRFEEAARYHAQFAGAPTSVWAPTSNTVDADRNNDIGTRSRFAAWVHEPGEDAVYVAWHTNAFDAAVTGTETYYYSGSSGTAVAGSVRLAQLVHGEFLNDARAPSGWSVPGWPDRGVKGGAYGEVSPANNGETPAILMEVAFHDAALDAARLKEPAFRYLAARAITQGLIKYFAEKDGTAGTLPPEPPTHLAVVNQAAGEAVIRWRAPPTDTEGVRGHAASSYRLSTSDDGLAWNDGVPVTTTSVRVSVPAGAARYFRVTALNAGGESFPSATVGVRAPAAGKPLVLVVNGYDRLDATQGTAETFPSRYALGSVTRIFLTRMNDGSYARTWGDALDGNQVGFDSAEADAVAAGDVAVAPYGLLAWFVGRGTAPSSAEQSVISALRTANVPVFFSGDATGSAAFLSGTLSATLPGGTGGLRVDGRDALLGLTGLALDDGSLGAYATGAPPVLGASGAAVTLAAYQSGGAAAVGTPRQSVVFGFPFETLVDRTQRVEVMRRVLGFLSAGGFDGGVVPIDAGTVLPPDGGPPPIDGGQGGGGGGGAGGGGGGAGDDAGVAVLPDGGVVRRPVLAFQGGGCAVSPSFLPLALLSLVALLRRRADPSR